MKYFTNIPTKLLAAYLAFCILISCQAQQVTPSPSTDNPVIKIALLLDTSNSMDGLIDQAKSQLWKIVNELITAKKDGQMATVQIALYEYGNNGLSVTNNYIRKVQALTSDLDEVSAKLFGLRTNGGEEYCGAVIQSATKELEWGNVADDLRFIFIAGNEPFTQGGVHFIDACNSARNSGIVVNTIFCGNYHEGIKGKWKQGADIANGSYMNIDSDKKTVYIQTPYDDQINQYNIHLNGTYYGYGRKGKMKKEMQTQEDVNAFSFSMANSADRVKFKTSKNYSSGTYGWDIVSKYKSDSSLVFEDIAVEEMPEEMQELDDEERLEFLEEKSTERDSINKELAALIIERDKYIASEKAKKAGANSKDMLDDAMLESIRKAAKSKNYSFEARN